jgi:Transcriptional regulators
MYDKINQTWSDFILTTNYAQRASMAKLINQARAEMVGALDHALAQFDLSAAQYVVISTLSTGNAETASQICKEISYSPGAMTRMLDRLEQKGMISRTRCTDNRRAVRLELTEEGKRIFPALLMTATTVIDRFFEVFDQNELNQFKTLLNKMLQQ